MNLTNNIKLQLTANEAGLGWSDAHLNTPERLPDLVAARRKLVANRVKLSRIKFAGEFNPAAAIFGESQVGKSYMVDALLSDEKNPLAIYDKDGNRFGFIESINPIGNGSEATAIISRFSRSSFSDNKDYPVRVILLSVADVVMLLSDSYYNDLKDPKLPREADIKAEIDNLKSRFGMLNNPVPHHLTADNVFEIMEYFQTVNFKKGDEFRYYLGELGYFDVLSSLIPYIPSNEWESVFSFFWNRDPHVNALFQKMLVALEAVDFQQSVYIPITPLLRLDGTILHVDRMYEMFGVKEFMLNGKTVTVETARVPDLDVWTGSRSVKMLKGEFCALAVEVDFTIQKPENVNPDRIDVLDHGIDILDFPGARSREDYTLSDVGPFESSQMLIRGKIAYLFNKYSRQYLISNLLFCHHDTKSEVNSLADLLKGWVENTIGETAEARQEYSQGCEIEPLFIIGTKFNIDMAVTPLDTKGSDAERLQVKNERWNKRFNKVLMHVLGTNASWLSNWTPGHPFQNMYLLRSFEYSQFSNITRTCRQVFSNEGWIDSKDDKGVLREKWGEFQNDGEKIQYADFIPALRESFLSNGFVRSHFRNPAESWDKAADLNNDGAKWIIENLLKAAGNAQKARERSFEKMVRSCCESFCEFVKQNYHDETKDQDVSSALSDAGAIQFFMDVLFGKDKYFFTDFIGSLLVTEDWAHDTIMDAISRMTVNEGLDLSVFFAIRDFAGIVSSDSQAEAEQKLMSSYKLASKDLLDEYLSSLKVSVQDLINPPKMLNNGLIIVSAVERKWFSEILTQERLSEFVRRGMPSKSIATILSRMVALYKKKLGLTEKIVYRISPYITDPGKMDDMVEMIADICTEMFNSFVTSFGTVYFRKELWDTIRKNIVQNNLDVTVRDDDPLNINVDDDEVRERMDDVFNTLDHLDEVIENLDSNRDKLQLVSYYSSYRKWTDELKVAFLALCDVPDYDPVANKELELIIRSKLLEPEEMAPYLTESIKNLSIAKAMN